MRTSDIKRLGEAWASVTSKEEELEEAKKTAEDASNDKEDDGEGIDKVDPKAAKKKFKDRKDKDIDNDGDVDDSDEYLHKRRKAIGKAMAKEEYEIYETNEYEAALELTEDSGTKYYTVTSKRTGRKYGGIIAKDPAAAVASVMKKEKGTQSKAAGGLGISRKDYSVKATSTASQKDAEDEYTDRKGEAPRSNYKRGELRHITNPTDADKKYSRDQVKRAAARKKAEISKIGESTDELLNMLESAAKAQKANATKPEGIMDKESPKSKEFANAHNKSDKKIEDNEEDSHDKTFKAGQATKAKSGKRPQDNQAGDTNIVKSTEAPAKGVKESKDVKEMFRDYTVVHTKTGRKMKIRAMTSNDAKKQAAERSGGGSSRYSGTSVSDFHVENNNMDAYVNQIRKDNEKGNQ